ncbi:RnfABCDGE type electron transport complex subunit D [Granulosicoccaceae sp. 1_MG-2023]|nr:RnfABCDGE type electron transport complex subunit D [Granulosicoccaceae sp. 1_MG-2023]
MQFATRVSPHTVGPASVNAVMRHVLVALLPGTLLYGLLFNAGVWLNILLAVVSAVAFEALILRLRGRPVGPAIGDLSAVLTAWLFALALPPLVPWWVIVTGVFFSIVIAKQLYGGLGFNPFNPAMVGYVVVLISFPRQLTAWSVPRSLESPQAPSLSQLWQTLWGQLPVDAFTHATPLGAVKTALTRNATLSEIFSGADGIGGWLGGHSWELLALTWLAGGIWLIRKGLIAWHIPAAFLGTLFSFALFFYLIDSDHFLNPLFHLFSGAAMLGAFFILTDPVTAPASPRGKLLFGAGAGVLVYVIRTWGGYPDAVAFAVLLMNLCAPAIDYFYRPPVFGERHG